jgi:hypothetical protein
MDEDRSPGCGRVQRFVGRVRGPLSVRPVLRFGDGAAELSGKILGPIAFLSAVVGGTLPLSFGVTILKNDLIWWAPFALILLRVYQTNGTLRERNA